MTKKYFVYPVFLVVFYILQYVAVPLSYSGVAPDLILILVVVAGIRESEKFAAVLGLIGGLLADYTSGVAFGLRGIIFMLMGYFLAILASEALSPNILSATVSGIAAYILTRLLYWGEYLVVMGGFSVKEMFLSVTLPEIILTLPFIPLVYALVALLTGKRSSDDSRARRSRRAI